MEFAEYKKHVSSLNIGKKLPTAIYLHESALKILPEALSLHIIKHIEKISLEDTKWNIIKLFKKDHKFSLLYYPDFDTYAYPALVQSTTIDIESLTHTQSNYKKSENTPILHRKETFVLDDYPQLSLFKEITAEGVAIGLYENPKTIGFKKNWERLIKSKGYLLNEKGRLLPISEATQNNENILTISGEIERHKTAINRHQLSKPMQIIANHNYLNGNYSVFDYGCGKGDDVRELEAHGLDVRKWDPVHYPDGSKAQADIVNLGFVLNVIEEKNEREETLKKAWSYAEKFLVVSVMVAGESLISQFTPYKDGIITKINTFQKYFSQQEIRYFIETVLDEQAIPVGQGVFLIFKDKLEEQNFLLERQYIHRNWQQKTIRELQTRKKVIKKSIIEKNIELFSDYWQTTLNLGRIPANDEFEFSEQIIKITGSYKTAHNTLLDFFGQETFNEAEKKRKDDLLVYFALGLFEKRRPQTKMPERLKRDIKVFFENYTSAIEAAKLILFSLSNTEVIEKACMEAHAQMQCGLYEEGHSYTFHKKYLGDLPPELRIYIGCATQLYGELEDIHLIKAHITSGKVSLLGYDDWDKDKPLLLERIKIKLREQDVDFFDYIDRFIPTVLKDKSIYIS